MNEGVPFFASLMATTTDKMGKKSLESVGKLEALESFKREKNKRQNGERKWEGCGQSRRKWSIEKLKISNFAHLFLTKNKPNHPNTIGVMFHPKIGNPISGIMGARSLQEQIN